MLVPYSISPPGGWGRQKPPPGVPLDRPHPLAAGLKLHWPFREGAGGIATDAASQVQASLVSTAWQHGGLSFDGSSSYVTMPGAISRVNTLAAGSLGVRFQCTASAINTIACLSAANYMTNWMAVYVRPGTSASASLGFFYGVNNVTQLGFYNEQGVAAYQDGRWHDAVFVVDGAANRMYVDGVRQTVAFYAGSATTKHFCDVASATVFYLGKRSYAGSPVFLQGGIDHFWVSSATLGDAMASRLYAEPYSMFASGEPLAGIGSARPLIDASPASTIVSARVAA